LPTCTSEQERKQPSQVKLFGKVLSLLRTKAAQMTNGD